MVTVHIKPTAPHHTTVLTASVKNNSTTRSFTQVISVRLSKNLAKGGTLAKSGCFTLLYILIWKIKFNLSQRSQKYVLHVEKLQIKVVWN